MSGSGTVPPARREAVMSVARADVVEPLPRGYLTDNDRCDRCGSRAYVRVDLAAGQLMFCAHHFQELEPRLREVAIHVLDERDRLHAESSRGSSYSPTSV
jgi:hypothetical protein